MKYGKQKYIDKDGNSKTYFVYNSYQMNKRTHGQMLKDHGVMPINGAETPVKKKFHNLMKCNVFCLEVTA